MPDDIVKNCGPYELHQHVSQSTLDLKRLPKISDAKINNDAIYSADQKLALVNGEIPQHRFSQAETFHRLYRAQSRERMDSLKAIYQELGEPETLVVMLFCKKYFPLFKNWLLSCDKNEIQSKQNLIVFCLDADSARKCKALDVKHYFLDPDIYLKAGGAGRFADESFRVTMLYKNAVILDSLQLGASVLFQDVDLIWLMNPLPQLQSQGQYYDIQIMYDGPSRRYSPLYCNSGFIFISPTDESKALFETALRNSACILKSGGHQYALVHIINHFLKNQLLRLHILPEHLYMNGHLFNTNGGIRPSARNWEKHGVVFHYSWTENIRQKFEKLHKFGMCYLEPEETKLLNSSENPIDSTYNHKNSQQTDSAKQIMKNQEIELTLHIAEQEPLELSCYSDDPIVETLFGSFISSKTEDVSNAVIHLNVMENNEPCAIFFRASDIRFIKTIPPLDLESLNRKESISYNPSK